MLTGKPIKDTPIIEAEDATRFLSQLEKEITADYTAEEKAQKEAENASIEESYALFSAIAE